MNFDVWVNSLSFLELLFGIFMDEYVLHYLVSAIS